MSVTTGSYCGHVQPETVAKCTAGRMSGRNAVPVMRGMMPKATADQSAMNGRQISAAPGPGAAMSLVGVIACEVTASLLVGLHRRPMLGLFFVGVGLAIAFGWLRRYRRHADAIAGDQIQTATRLLAEGSHAAAWDAADAAARASAGTRLRDAALTVMVQVAIAEKHCETAREVLGRMRRLGGLVDPCLEAAIERADGRADRATAALERARGLPTFSGAAARLLVELYAEAERLDRAVQIALEHLDLLEVHDVRNMIASLEAWDEPQHAAALVMALTIRSSRTGRQIRIS
jgi:hypothetical protein